MRAWLGLIAVVGCNRAFGIQSTELEPPLDADRADADPRADFDRDGIKDIDDPCIAPEVDALLDEDGDGRANAVDGCPADTSTADTDVDGVGDRCDPFPTAPGDGVRCLMMFNDPDLNVMTWRPREDPQSWVLYQPGYVFGSGGSLASDWRLEGPTVTTFDVVARMNWPFTGRYAVLPRAAVTPSPADAGCELVADNNGMQVRVVPDGVAKGVSSVPPGPIKFHLQVTIDALTQGESRVSCSLRFGTDTSVNAAAVLTLPSGQLALVTTRAVNIDAIVIYERADVPPL